MRLFLSIVILFFLSNLVFGQKPEATARSFNRTEGMIISKLKFNFFGTSDKNSFRNAVYEQTEMYVANNIDDELYEAALSNNIIKFEKPYINFTVWFNNQGIPDISLFGSNISINKQASDKLKIIVGALNFDETIHPGLKNFHNRQITFFVALERLEENGKTTYISVKRDEEKQAEVNKIHKSTFPAYYKSCFNVENAKGSNFEEIRTGAKKCTKYQITQYLTNHFNRSLVRNAIKRVSKEHNIEKPKLKVWISFKFNEYGQPCEYQGISLFPELEEETIKLIQQIPEAIPAVIRGKKVKYKYRFPLNFY